MSNYMTAKVFTVLCGLSVIGHGASINFVNVKIEGIRQGQSNGLSWGFVDGDNYPDLFIARHNESSPVLHLNTPGDGNETARNLVESTDKYLADSGSYVHKHSAQWADFDNDGDQDLLVLQGTKKGWGGYPNQLYLNSPQLPFPDAAGELNLTYAGDRGLLPLFFDYDSDGLLDVLLCSGLPRQPLRHVRSASRILKQVSTSNSRYFIDVTEELNIEEIKEKHCEYASLADVNDDGRLDTVMKVITPQRVPHAWKWTNSSAPEDLAKAVKLPGKYYGDWAFADFNGDLKVDMFGVPYCLGSTKIQQTAENILDVLIQRGTQWFSFYTEGHLELGTEINHAPVPEQAVYATVNGRRSRILALTLPDLMKTNVMDLEFHGWYRIWNVSNSVSSTGWWHVLLSAYQQDIPMGLAFRSSKPITSVTESTKRDRRPPAKLQGGLLNIKNSGIFRSKSIKSHVDICGVSLVAADFDNDMDVDIFVLKGSVYCEKQSFFLWNDGKGNFRPEESSPFDCSQHYRPESAAIADYNLDGLVDIAITSGYLSDPFRLGSYGVFENAANNSNNWIEIRLIGSGPVNRDAIGSWVIAKTPDGKRQYRAQGGGMHGRAQDWQMIHFGLGNNTQVTLEVHWTDQTVSVLPNVKVNHVIEVFREEDPQYQRQH